MQISAIDAARRLPVRSPRLVSWSLSESRQHLARNRSTGETFRLGEEEQFLLEKLDGRLSAEQIQVAFEARFGQTLSTQELQEFIDLATGHGFLQSENDERKSIFPRPLSQQSVMLGLRTQHTNADQNDGSPPRGKRIVGNLFNTAETLVQSCSRCLQAVQRRIHLLHLKHISFIPRADDVFIVTYPRSGTTWLQMILYQLTTDGSMDIPHIAEYCPWFERSLRSGRGFETQPPPRIFKSHLPYRAIPKGPAKYIYVARDGRDVAVSYYHLYRTYIGFRGAFVEFFDRFMQGKVQFGSWFDHVREWAEHRHDANVLFLTYERLTRDLEGCVRDIIAFCGWEIPTERLPRILERCSFGFMKQHESKFDPTIETLWEQGVQLNSFLRAGKAGEGALQLSGGQQEQFARVFRRHFKNEVTECWSVGRGQRRVEPLHHSKATGLQHPSG